MDSDSKGLSLGKVAQYCGVTRKTILRWINSGLLASFSLPSGHNRVLPSEVTRFLQEHQMPIPEELSLQHKKKVLVVDDEENIRKLEANLLRPYFDVKQAANGVEACMAIGHEPPDLLVIDIRMPKMDGIEVCRYIRSQENLSKMAIVIVSAHVTGDMKPTLESLVNKVLSKPFSPQELVDTCLEAVNSPRLV